MQPLGSFGFQILATIEWQIEEYFEKIQLTKIHSKHRCIMGGLNKNM